MLVDGWMDGWMDDTSDGYDLSKLWNLKSNFPHPIGAWRACFGWGGVGSLVLDLAPTELPSSGFLGNITKVSTSSRAIQMSSHPIFCPTMGTLISRLTGCAQQASAFQYGRRKPPRCSNHYGPLCRKTPDTLGLGTSHLVTLVAFCT